MKIYDLIGIGFGPSNIGLAVALYEDYDANSTFDSILFFESKRKHGWHHPMMVDGAKMQISFMKDLCMLRNPKSHFTFLNYLKENDRLIAFANLRDFNPSRREFDCYLAWVAKHFEKIVQYSSTAQSITPVLVDGVVKYLDVEIINNNLNCRKIYRTRNLTIAVGGEPKMPVEIDDPRIFHSSLFLEKISQYDEQLAHRFLIVGAGQSAAEIYRYLINRYKSSSIWVGCRGIGFKQSDESEYVNEIFNNDMVDLLYNLSPEKRKSLIAKHADTNYSVVDIDLIRELYRTEYEEGLIRTPNFGIKQFVELHDASADEKCIKVSLKSLISEEIKRLDVDAVICATGYKRPHDMKLLSGIKPFALEDDENQFVLSRNYALQTSDTFKPKIFIQGMSESTHGLSDTLLSVISTRAGEISSEFIKVMAVENQPLRCESNH